MKHKKNLIQEAIWAMAMLLIAVGVGFMGKFLGLKTVDVQFNQSFFSLSFRQYVGVLWVFMMFVRFLSESLIWFFRVIPQLSKIVLWVLILMISVTGFISYPLLFNLLYFSQYSENIIPQFYYKIVVLFPLLYLFINLITTLFYGYKLSKGTK
jgi:hypothetical protein